MYKTFLFSFAVVFCVNVYVISAKEASANEVVIAQPEVPDFISVDTAEVKKLHLNGSELEVARTDDDCECENGKCMRKCDIDKTIPCVDERKVCVCDPEYEITTPTVCKHCDCGHGFNCTFKWTSYEWEKNCICPKGYFNDRYTDECKIECSDEQPCRHGGTCSDQRCSCPTGTFGELCDQILYCSDCAGRLEVDCFYDYFKTTSYCKCRNASLYYDYSRDICIPCPCENGNCVYELTFYSRKLKCECFSGYKEFLGYCKECDCGYGRNCEFDYNGKKICDCKEGYFEREGQCVDCRCGKLDTKCEVNGNEKRCFCDEGYQDVLGHCEDINECETNNTCDPSTTCYNTLGGFECQCPDGYKGYGGCGTVKPGDECYDVNECNEKFDACYYSTYTRCVNLPGSYKCECKPGYEPYNYVVQPQDTSCIETKKSWGPALIVIFTSCILIGLSYFMHSVVRKRAIRSN